MHTVKALSAVALLLCVTHAAVAGEIILTPKTDSGKSTAAIGAENREKARAYLDDGKPAPGTTVIVVPDDEEGMLAPRGSGILSPSGAGERAKEYVKKPGVQNRIVIVPERDPSKPPTRKEQTEINHSKARAWVKGESPERTWGADKLPLVNCREADSVSGRIGDDTLSGSVITVFQNGRQVKVRCK